MDIPIEKYTKTPSEDKAVSKFAPKSEDQLFRLNIGGGISINDLKDPRIKEKIVNSLQYRV